ncbi:MAG TPA: hypothetical protein VL175_04310 [Pirellulales bacterium]|nr:hypothetical protein [Pirellulales bacterium]
MAAGGPTEALVGIGGGLMGRALATFFAGTIPLLEPLGAGRLDEVELGAALPPCLGSAAGLITSSGATVAETDLLHPRGGTTCTMLPHFGQARISPRTESSLTFSRARQVVHSIVNNSTAQAQASRRQDHY